MAAAVWQERHKSFNLRLKIVDRIIQIGLGAEHWYQPSQWADQSGIIESRAASTLLSYSLATTGQSMLGVEEYVSSTVAGPIGGATDQTWRNHEPRVLKHKPSENEITAVAGTSVDWSRVPFDWKCPCCGRDKVAVIQPSGQKPMGFVLRSMRAEGLSRRDPEVLVCNECGWTASCLAKEAGTIPEFVSFADVRDVIFPIEHGAHRIRSSAAEVDGVVERVRERAVRIGGRRALRSK